MGFYDLLKDYFLKVVRESKSSRKVLGALKYTFLFLILKKQKGISFDDYMPISCCNVIYKLISNIIALRLKPIMSTIISEEQFRFLQGRQIHDTISLAQEALHSIKTLKKPTLVLNIDLSKEYNRVSWTFLRLFILKMGMKISLVNYIMGCVSSTSFVVLINGSSFGYF
jgi:hypothetical protein